MRTRALLLTAVLLAACDSDILSPSRLSPADATARAAAASSLTATATSATQIDLAWADNSGSETGWEIHRSTTGASGGPLVSTSVSVRMACKARLCGSGNS